MRGGNGEAVETAHPHASSGSGVAELELVLDFFKAAEAPSVAQKRLMVECS